MIQPTPKDVLPNRNMNLAYNNFEKKKILCVYSDTKLYTHSTLKKLESDLLKEYDIECLYSFSLNGYPAKTLDKLFFFYFLTNGREQDQAINETVSRMSMSMKL